MPLYSYVLVKNKSDGSHYFTKSQHTIKSLYNNNVVSLATIHPHNVQVYIARQKHNAMSLIPLIHSHTQLWVSNAPEILCQQKCFYKKQECTFLFNGASRKLSISFTFEWNFGGGFWRNTLNVCYVEPCLVLNTGFLNVDVLINKSFSTIFHENIKNSHGCMDVLS